MRAAASISLLVFVLALVGGAMTSVAAAPPTATAPCSREATRTVVRSFVSAFDAGDFARLDSVFAPEPAFQWYSTPAPGQRLGAAAKQRDTLLPYLRRRYQAGDRFRLHSFDWNGRSPHWSNFGFEMRRSSPAVDRGAWLTAIGKGAAICEAGAPQLIVLTFGVAVRT